MNLNMHTNTSIKVCLFIFFLLWCSLFLGCQRIAKSTTDSDGRSQNSVSFHGFLENNGGNHNNDNTFCGIQHRRSNSPNSCCECESEFVVNVEKESRQDNVDQKWTQAVLSH